VVARPLLAAVPRLFEALVARIPTRPTVQFSSFGKIPCSIIQKVPNKPANRAWWGTVVLFLAHGLVVSTWVSRIPAVQTALRLPNGLLGLTLLSSAVGAVSTIPVTGWLINRYGSKRVTILASLLFCSSVTLIGLAFNTLTLSAALFIFGACAAAMDVSMNAQGVDVEKYLGTPTMSRFHGMFSLGGMIGAGLGGWAAAHGMKVLPHFALSTAINLAAVASVAPLLLDVKESTLQTEHRLPLSKVPPVLLALSAISFCCLLSEGAMADWTAVYLKQVLRAGPGLAAAGYSVFSASMAIFRFLGDLITARLGPMRTVRTGSLVAAVGLVWALFMPSAYWALPGFAAAGAGFSVIIPLVFGSGGRVESIRPGAGIATVTGIGYLGFIVGPPAIGFASQLFTLRYALGIVVACCLISALLSKSMRALKPPGAPAPTRAAEIHF
jgi:MFS family permease